MIRSLHRELLESDPDYYITDVKEKFGTLRFYTGPLSDEGWGLVTKYEELSGAICESCGAPGEVKGPGWLKCRCEKCNAT